MEDSNEFQPCRPDEIFECLKTYFTILKVAGLYFENSEEMENIKKSRNDVKCRKSCPTFEKAKVTHNAGKDLQGSHMRRQRPILNKVHRFYCKVILILHWLNALRVASMFTAKDTFGSDLFFKIIVIDYIVMCAGMVTVLHWACASGKFVTVIISLAGLRGVDANYLRKLDKNTCRICGGAFLLNIGFMIFGIFKLEWMYQPIGAPINTWILTENEDLQTVARIGILSCVIFVLVACFSASSVSMVLCLIIRRSITFVKEDLKLTMALICSVGKKKNMLFRYGNINPCNTVESGTTELHNSDIFNPSALNQIDPPLSHYATEKSKCSSGKTKVECDNWLFFEELRQRFQYITKVIRRADSFISVFNACGICGYLIEMISALYIVLWYSCRYIDEWAYLATLSLWFINAFLFLAYVCFSPVLVNNEAQRMLEKLHDIDLSHYSLEVLNLVSIFLLRMSTDNIGFSVLHLFVIDKNTICTIIGLFVTYFLLIYQLNPDNGSYCNIPATEFLNNSITSASGA